MECVIGMHYIGFKPCLDTVNCRGARMREWSVGLTDHVSAWTTVSFPRGEQTSKNDLSFFFSCFSL